MFVVSGWKKRGGIFQEEHYGELRIVVGQFNLILANGIKWKKKIFFFFLSRIKKG